MVLGATALDAYASVRQIRRRMGEPVRRAITVARPAHEVYAYWRQLTNLPMFMKWVESVEDRPVAVARRQTGHAGEHLVGGSLGGRP